MKTKNNHWPRRRRWLAAASALAVAGALWAVRSVDAADHADPPDRASDTAADMGDLYAWHTTDDALVAVITVGTRQVPADPQSGLYDRDVLYGIHVDTDGDVTTGPEHDIYVRFGQDGAGNWGVRAENVPGLDEPLVGPVETNNEQGGVRLFAGLRDDPFFFDLTGFTEVMDTGTLLTPGGELRIQSDRDSLAGTNVTAIVLEVPLSSFGGGPVQVWSSTARIGG